MISARPSSHRSGVIASLGNTFVTCSTSAVKSPKKLSLSW